MTPAEAARRELARRELARRELERREREMLPLPRASAAPVTFADPQEVEAAAREVQRTTAEERITKLYDMPSDASSIEAEQREAERVRAEQERKRSRVGMPGVEGPVQLPEEGVFRPSRIETVETFTPFPVEGQGVLLDPPEPEVVAEADLPAPFDPITMQPTLRRMYRDPATGTYTVPTLEQEFRETFALQTERGEAGLRDRQQQLADEERRVRLAIEAGEPVPLTDRIVYSPVARVLTRPQEGKGIVETELASVLRSALSWGSAAAAEGYFRGLGYEVDERGMPVDPNDWAYEVAKVRERLGIPAVVNPLGGLVEAIDFYGARAGLDEESIQTLQNVADSIPQLAMPLPGVATESQTRKVTTFDPEGRRRVEDIEVPDFFEDPRGFLEAEALRITQNVAKGRTWGDEYLDTPAVRDYYAYATGDADNAYIAGMVPEIIIPGPEILAGGVGYVVGAATDLARLARVAKPLVKAGLQADNAHATLRAAKAAGRTGDDLVPLQRAADESMARFTELLDASQDYDPSLLRKVAGKSADKVFGPDSAQASAVRAALKEADAGDTLTDVTATLRRTVGDEGAARIVRLTSRNLPADYVPLTDTISVPRRALKGAQAALKEHRATAFVKTAPEILDDLYGIARRLPEGPVKQQVLRTYVAARRSQDAAETMGRGYSALDRGVRRQVQQAVRAAGRELGEADPRTFARAFDQRPPRDLPIGNTELAQDLAKYDSWQDVPAQLRRRATDAYDMQYPQKFAKGARSNADLTRAQMYFRTAETGLRGLAQRGLLRSKLLDGPRMRQFLARYGRLQTETKAAADIGREIELAGRTSLRTMRAKLLRMVNKHGNVEDAVDELLVSELSQAGESPSQAWEALWSALYGDTVKDDLIEKVLQDRALPMDRLGGRITEYPTVETARAIDRRYSDLEGVLPGITPDMAAGAERVGLGGIVTPNIENAMLRVVFENGLRKNIAREKRITGALQTAVEELPLSLNFARNQAGTLADRLQRLLPIPSRGAVLDVEGAPQLGNRIQVYDRAAGIVEKELGDASEALVTVLDDVPVRQRADVAKMAGDAADFVFGTGRRNLFQRLQYGYIVPNLPVQVGRMLQMAVVPMVTIGARNTLQAFDRAGQKALSALTRRRVLGGGITTPDGVYYSPKLLDDLADEYGLGITQLETERVGSLASDMTRDARRAARAAQGPGAKAVQGALEVGDPFSRGFFLRVAESAELNFRKSVFEMALARGDTPQQAADLARRSQFDYTEVPDAVRNFAGRFLGESSAIYRAGAEGLAALAKNPRRAARVLRAMRAKAETQDPYNIHGDKALKSLGIVQKDEDEVYYLPEMPFLRPAEAAIGTVRAADKLMDDLRFATEQSSTVLGAVEGVTPTLEAAVRAGGEVVAPAIMAAYDRFQGGEEYQTTGVPEAEPMSDEKAFWAAMVLAQNRDPQHDNGAWDTFLRYMPAERIAPPSGMGSEDVPGAWKQQPPDGIPHVLHDVIDGRAVYFALKPTPEALRNIRVMRTLDALDLDRALPFYALLNEQEGTTPPLRVYTEGRTPDTLQEAALQTILPSEQVIPERAIERQAATVRDIREDIEVQ